ncbi:MAG: BON domain-containing protein [Candidatus Solibacter usitatus]|nr:BON domain-containing protein [Candidatus Solibacter usitatus]
MSCKRALLLTLCLLLAWTTVLPAQSNANDDRIYDQVRLRLANHPEVKGAAFEVKVVNGMVTLQGKVRSEKARQKAESLTHKIKGVKKVVNELVVVPS